MELDNFQMIDKSRKNIPFLVCYLPIREIFLKELKKKFPLKLNSLFLNYNYTQFLIVIQKKI